MLDDAGDRAVLARRVAALEDGQDLPAVLDGLLLHGDQRQLQLDELVVVVVGFAHDGEPTPQK